MKRLQDRIRAEGRVLPGNIIKVDGFLNHRVDMALMREIAKEFKSRFDLAGLTAVLTVEASGIALAAMCADELNVPLIFAKKAKSDNEGGPTRAISILHIKSMSRCSCPVNGSGRTTKVLVIDDFLPTARCAAWSRSCRGGAELSIAWHREGLSAGRSAPARRGRQPVSLAIIERADEHGSFGRNMRERVVVLDFGGTTSSSRAGCARRAFRAS